MGWGSAIPPRHCTAGGDDDTVGDRPDERTTLMDADGRDRDRELAHAVLIEVHRANCAGSHTQLCDAITAAIREARLEELRWALDNFGRSPGVSDRIAALEAQAVRGGAK